MFPVLYLSDTVSSIVQLNLVLALGMLVPLLLSRVFFEARPLDFLRTLWL